MRRKLRQAGLSNDVINAAWPAWWSDDAVGSPSADAELRFTLARRLGLSPSALVVDHDASFVWHDTAKFKRLQASHQDAAILTAFGRATANSVSATVPVEARLPLPSAPQLREAILDRWGVVDLRGLLGMMWGHGLPVVYLRVFPLEAKRMDAMSVRVADRAVVLLARDTRFPASLAFTLAHEMGHIACGHVETEAVVDIGDPVRDPDRGDFEEVEANRFAKELLAGHPDFEPVPTHGDFNSDQLAQASLQLGNELGIDPGVVALCAAFSTGRWRQASGALKILGEVDENLAANVNGLAMNQLDLAAVSDDRADYLRRLMGVDG